MLDEIYRLREYEGIRRKSWIGEVVKNFVPFHKNFGEDAAVIDFGEEALLLAADGIWEKIMQKDPEWSGYCAVLVNLHDIAAMGGVPLAMVNVLSASSRSTCRLITRGMRKAVIKFGIPIVGGHFHPDSQYDAIDVAVLGRARKEEVIYSSTARVGDRIVMGVDLKGKFYLNGWDSTRGRTKKVVLKQLSSMHKLAEMKVLTAGKDISNPGMLGTLGMLLELSGKGAWIDLPSVPIPRGVGYERWLTTYPGMGFLVTCAEEDVKKVVNVFRRNFLSASCIGWMEKGKRLRVSYRDEERTIFDFKKDRITGITGEGKKGKRKSFI